MQSGQNTRPSAQKPEFNGVIETRFSVGKHCSSREITHGDVIQPRSDDLRRSHRRMIGKICLHSTNQIPKQENWLVSNSFSIAA